MLCPHLLLIFFSVWRWRFKLREGNRLWTALSSQGWEDWSPMGVARWQQRVGRGREDLLIFWWSTKCHWLCASPSSLFLGHRNIQIWISHLETSLSELWVDSLASSLPETALFLTPEAPNQKLSPPGIPSPVVWVPSTTVAQDRKWGPAPSSALLTS